MSDSFWPSGPYPIRLLRPWDFPGKNTGVGCHFLLQGKESLDSSFPTEGSNPGLPHGRQTPYCLSHQGSPEKKWKPKKNFYRWILPFPPLPSDPYSFYLLLPQSLPFIHKWLIIHPPQFIPSPLHAKAYIYYLYLFTHILMQWLYMTIFSPNIYVNTWSSKFNADQN